MLKTEFLNFYYIHFCVFLNLFYNNQMSKQGLIDLPTIQDSDVWAQYI